MAAPTECYKMRGSFFYSINGQVIQLKGARSCNKMQDFDYNTHPHLPT